MLEIIEDEDEPDANEDQLVKQEEIEFVEYEQLDEDFIMEMEKEKHEESSSVLFIDDSEDTSQVVYLDLSNQSTANKFRCLICQMLKFDVEFDTEKEKIEHLRTHTKEELQCQICLRQMVFAKILDKHLERHQLPTQLTANPNIVRTVAPPVKSKYQIEFKCYICDEIFPMRSLKDAHLNNAHSDFNMRCKICLKKFRSIIGIDNHLKVSMVIY
jgi:uncharacterized C2H2 Zn-finger protein